MPRGQEKGHSGPVDTPYWEPPLQVNANGSVLLSEIVGTIKLKVFLSGMPELRLGLNDRVLFELTGRKIGGKGEPSSWE